MSQESTLISAALFSDSLCYFQFSFRQQFKSLGTYSWHVNGDSISLRNRFHDTLQGYALARYLDKQLDRDEQGTCWFRAYESRVAKHPGWKEILDKNKRLYFGDKSGEENMALAMDRLVALYQQYKTLKDHQYYKKAVHELLRKTKTSLTNPIKIKLMAAARKLNGADQGELTEMLMTEGELGKGFKPLTKEQQVSFQAEIDKSVEAFEATRVGSSSVDTQPYTALSAIQRFARSRNRLKEHAEYLKAKPSSSWHQAVPDCLRKFSDRQRVFDLIMTLAEKRAVTGNTVDHYTTLDNFKSMIKMGAICGNRGLTDRQITFTRNCLGDVDEFNADANSVCFTPMLVDPKAVAGEISHENADSPDEWLKQGLIKLTLDTEVIEKQHQAKQEASRYHQYFKLNDACMSDFRVKVILDESLTVEVSKEQSATSPVVVRLTYTDPDELSKPVAIIKTYSINDSLFYGKSFSINAFCLIQLFCVIEKASVEIQERILATLAKKDDAVLALIMVGFAQAVTVFSELNFWSYLPLTEDMITKVTFCRSNQMIDLACYRILEGSPFPLCEFISCSEEDIKERYGNKCVTPIQVYYEEGYYYIRANGVTVRFTPEEHHYPDMQWRMINQYLEQENTVDISESEWNPLNAQLNVFRHRDRSPIAAPTMRDIMNSIYDNEPFI